MKRRDASGYPIHRTESQTFIGGWGVNANLAELQILRVVGVGTRLEYGLGAPKTILLRSPSRATIRRAWMLFPDPYLFVTSF